MVAMMFTIVSLNVPLVYTVSIPAVKRVLLGNLRRCANRNNGIE